MSSEVAPKNSEQSIGQVSDEFNGKRILRRFDSLYLESSTVPGRHGHDSKAVGWSVILHLAFQSIGIVYGDIGTSPLYVYASTFTDGIKHNDDILGGTFALYSLICRYAKVGLIPNQQAEDQDVSNFQLVLPSSRQRIASVVKAKLENSQFAKFFLLFATMLGTSMVIGDVLSAVGGITNATTEITEDMIVWISVAILIFLFMVQRFGTDKVGYTFAPIICVWFAFIGGIGLFNFIKFDPTVIKAINPQYIVQYFQRNKKEAWVSLVRSIQVSMCSVTYPALILAYAGQASFLRKHNDLVKETFYKSIPEPLYWPMFVVAIFSSIVASQAMISGTFSIVQQSLSLGCFPRVKIVHTSAKYEGQVYIPEVNYLLMLACVGVTLAFKSTTKIGNAYAFLVIIMIMIWKSHILLVISYVLVIGSVELLYLSSVFYKFDQGGYLPLAFAAILMTIMYIWNDVHRRKYFYELDHKISLEKLKEIAAEKNLCRMPGLAMFYSELVQGIPPIFKHYVENVPALHSVLVFLTIKSLPISKVPVEERFLFRRVKPRDQNVFRCVVRYGYTDVRSEDEPFEKMLVERLKQFIINDFWFSQRKLSNGENDGELEVEFVNEEDENEDVEHVEEELEREIEAMEQASHAGIVHLIGENEVVACKGAGIGKRFLINYAFNFLKKNLRQTENVFEIPHKRMLKVGMTYEL
ncbi:potassium transporter 5 [Quercus suber]|uniref:Potassium transporter 5 n=1 Tax=Quercus suber TaxID=58331 RepID=A0AAW0KWX9_QUESU